MKRFRQIASLIVLLLGFAFLLSCGGGGDSDTSSTLSGQFIDSPVAGLTYKTETQSGVTDAEGWFNYREGETVSFFVDSLLLGDAPGAPTITPLDLIDGSEDETDPAVTNICRFIQTLDDDDTPDNGIQLPDALVINDDTSSIDFSLSPEIFEADDAVRLAVSKLTSFRKAGQRELVDAETARNHFRKSLGKEVASADDDLTDDDAASTGEAASTEDGSSDAAEASTAEAASAEDGSSDSAEASTDESTSTEDGSSDAAEASSDQTSSVVAASSDTSADSSDSAASTDTGSSDAGADSADSAASTAAGSSDTGADSTDSAASTDADTSDAGEDSTDTAASTAADSSNTGADSTDTAASADADTSDAGADSTDTAASTDSGDTSDDQSASSDDSNNNDNSSSDSSDTLADDDNEDLEDSSESNNAADQEKGRLKIWTRLASGDEVSGIDEIWLDVVSVEACGAGGCEVVGGALRFNLLDAGASAVALGDLLLSERKLNQIRLVLGDDNTVVADGETHPLTVPGSGNGELKLLLDKDVKQGKQQALLLDVDPAENVKFTSGSGYRLDSNIKVTAAVEAPVNADTVVVDPVKGGKLQKAGKFEMTVPAGAVSEPGILWGEESDVIGPTSLFTLGPDGTEFEQPLSVALAYDPDKVSTCALENDLVILHDGLAIPTTVDPDGQLLKGEITHFCTLLGGSQATLKYQWMVPPEDEAIIVAPGERFDFAFYLKNTTGPKAINYKLVEGDGSNFDDALTDYPEFTIDFGAIGPAYVKNFPAPQTPGDCLVYFNILDTCEDVLPHLALGTVYVEFTVVEAPVLSLTKPILDSPSDGSGNISLTPSLKWHSVDRAQKYRVCLDSSESRLINTDASCSDCLFKEGGLTGISASVPSGKLENNKIYFWKVTAWAADIGSATSDIWSFTTGSDGGGDDGDDGEDDGDDGNEGNKDPQEEDPQDTECDSQAVLVYGGEQITPAGAAPGEPVTVAFTLTNQSNVDAVNYTLQTLDAGITSSPFTISSGGTGTARIENIPYPGPGEVIYFDLVDGCGNVLEPLPGGRMYIGNGSGANGPCGNPTPPVINSARLWQSGCGNVGISADVTGNEGDPSSDVNGISGALSSLTSGLFGAVSNVLNLGMNAVQVAAQGMCDTSTTFGPMDTPGICSDRLGDYSFKSPCKGTSGTEGDPVNSAIGNFFYRESDGIVAGLGGTTIRMNRAYNSAAAVWTPASIVQYTQNDDGEMEEETIAGPPLYFGKGWTSIFGEYLLVVDMEPQFKGLQMLYADGHTALFEETGDGVYTSESPYNFDEITEEDGEYVLRHVSCKCSLDSKRFNADGRLIAISDKNGNEIQLTYDGDNLAAVENASGRKITFTSDGEGRIIKAVLPEGIVLEYEYTDEVLTAFVNGRGLRTEYRYDGNNQMTEVISPKSHPSVRIAYDSDFLVSEQIVGENEKHVFDYSDARTTITNAYGSTSVHHYDDEKRLVQVDHADGGSEYYEYDDDFNRTYYMDQAGAEWHWTYDENGNRLTADGPLGWHREWTYNELNQVISMTENMDASTARTTTFEYDDKGNLIKFCNALGACGSVIYDGKGQPLELTDFAGNKTFHAYDAEGDLIAVTDAEAAVMQFSHDGLGRVTQMTKPMGSVFKYTYDPNSNLTAVDGPIGYHMGFAFDENDHLSVKTDPNGGEIHYEYNASDRLASVVNQLQFSTATYVYGLMNELTGVTDAEGRSWAYAYDNLLRVTQVSGPLNTNFGYEYNPVGKITGFTDANGIITQTEYDDLYRPVTVIRNYRPAEASNSDTNVTVSYAYNLVGDLLSVTDPEGYLTKYAYDLQSRRIQKQDAEGYEWEFTYDPMGNLLKTLNPRGYTTSVEYTPTYRVSRVLNPESHAVAFQHDADGRLTDRTDAKEIVTHFDYDELGRRISVIRNYQPAKAGDSETNVTSEFAYDLAGNLIGVTNPRGYDSELVYDAAHRRTEMADFEDGRTLFVYDKVNNLLRVTDAEGNPTNYTYDDLNRMTAVTNAEDETKSFQYDPMGNRTQLTEADGTVTYYGYDAIYRLNQVTQNYVPGADPGNDINVLTRYAYDARGLLTQITNANGAVTAFDYNAVGRMVKETDPLNHIWEYAYDGMGNRVSRTDAKGDLTEYDYYPDDLLEEIRYADGASVAYAYDPNNNRVSMEDSLGLTAWSYDPLNRITEADDPFSRTLSYGYDAAGNRVNMVYPDGNQVGYTYSPNNWMASVSGAEDLFTQYERDKVGNLTHIANSNSTETDYEYDRVYRTLSLVNRQTGNNPKIHTGFTYTYNKVGHVTEAVKEYGWRNPSLVTETYDYDGLHRLIGAVIDPIKNNGEQEVTSYAYDPVGNRLMWESSTAWSTSTLTDGFTKTYAYNEANQLLTVDVDSVKQNKNINLVETYTYDPNGNRINRLRVDENDKNALVEGVDYTFDPENRLVQALNYQLSGKDQGVRTDRSVTDLEYDGGGRRLVKHYDPKSNDAGGVDKEVQYVFDGLDPVAEYEMLNGQRENFYRGAMGRMVAMHHYQGGTQGQMYWYHYNHKGDVAGLTKQNGNSHHTYRYDPYGGVVPEDGNFTDPHNHYTLTGKEYDEDMGVVWFGARHYDPEAGVWLTQDLYRGKLWNPKTMHRYGYIEESPVSHFDVYGYATNGEVKRIKPIISTVADMYDIPPVAIALILELENKDGWSSGEGRCSLPFNTPMHNDWCRQGKQFVNFYGNLTGATWHCSNNDCSMGVGNIKIGTAKDISNYFNCKYPNTSMALNLEYTSDWDLITNNLVNDQRNVYFIAANLRWAMDKKGYSGMYLTNEEIATIVQHHNSSAWSSASQSYYDDALRYLIEAQNDERELQFLDDVIGPVWPLRQPKQSQYLKEAQNDERELQFLDDVSGPVRPLRQPKQPQYLIEAQNDERELQFLNDVSGPMRPLRQPKQL